MELYEFAEAMDGSEYGKEGTPELFSAADESGVVIVFGYSDDNVEFRGAIADEVPCYEGGKIYLTNRGLLENHCEEHDCPYFEAEKKRAAVIEAVWCEEGYSWTYKTDIPHATFEVMEDGEKYCRGIVFRLADVPVVEAALAAKE